MTDPDFTPVTAAVIEEDGKVLIARRKRGYMGYLWEFPGGKLEDNESLEECLKREIREELGIEIEVGPLINSAKHVLNCQSAINLYAYWARHVSGEVRLKDHDEVRWVSVTDLLTFDFPEPDRVIVRALLNDRR